MADLVRVAEYQRDFGASLERMFENALDWEHLPHVHAHAFSSIALVEERASGWRANVGTPQGGELLIDLELDRETGCWTTNSYAGEALIGRIVTHAEKTGPDSCRVGIAFLVPDPDSAQRDAFAGYYPALYAMLYDEDEAMMIARAGAVERGPAALGERRMIELANGETEELPRYCPHLGLPLDAEPDTDGTITCPWHGYRFDIVTGKCISGAACGWAV
ncbi:Rieske (2Fe-2S) protein [Parasphingopyxis algicola]|uniref:Rieske (2Fe-2S) protein n=1 Tax=Parasphingopyxis algicola TaxID=2026624 RepID=UPI0015A27BAF|nr:Rieske (2Fe-2S) protein [Parasphingopyxis algicola]QLC25176.1 Rieske (2Fe-2S) protein [Parasphingopyxis algicola]